MKIRSFLSLLDSSPKDRSEKFRSMLKSERNKLIDTHKDYYNGQHWARAGKDERVSRTRAGKLIWGKSGHSNTGNDPYARDNNSSTLGYGAGQLQVRNYVKTFIQLYQSYVTGTEHDDVRVVYEPGGSIQERLDQMWKDVRSFMKEEIARGVVTTMMVAKVDVTEDMPSIEIIDASNIFPIYRKNKKVGTIYISEIDALEAKSYGVITEDDAIYVEVYFNVDGQYYLAKFIDGKSIIEGGNIKLRPERNFDPYVYVPNIDHAFRNFDEKDLEDSEIFNWIEKLDSLNSNETIAFITNQFKASPNFTIDHELAFKIGADISSDEMKSAYLNWQYDPGNLSSALVKMVPGENVDDNFYKGKNEIRDAIFEDAAVAKFMLSGDSMNNVAAETVRLGFQALERKVVQQREQLIMLIRMASAIMAIGYGEELEDGDIETIRVELPEIIQPTKEELYNNLITAYEKGVLPKAYVQSELLKLMGREEDIEAVKLTEQDELNNIRTTIESQRRLTQSKLEAESEVKVREEQKTKVRELQNQLTE